MEKVIYFLARIRIIFQTFFALLLNSDLAVVIKAITQKKALISQSPLKRFCVPALNCYSCPAAVSSCPIGSIQFWFNDLNTRIRFGEKLNAAGLYIIGMLSLVGTLGGRIACGWICPFGFIQELINKLTKKNLNIPAVLRKLRYVSLAVFVIILPLFMLDIRYLSPWFCKLLCPAGTLTAGLPLLLLDKGLRDAASVITVIKFSGLGIFMVLFLISRRAFCKTLCPLGAFWGLFNKISLYRLKRDSSKCIRCGTCEKVCPMNIKVMKEPNVPDCVRCLECVKNCPERSMGFGMEGLRGISKEKESKA
jgi:ferredoxin-type protein NapH